MTLRRTLAALCTAALLAAAAPALAGTRVGGDLEIDVRTGHVVTVSSGILSKARTDIGNVMEGTRVSGNLKRTVRVGHVVTVSKGIGSKTCTRIGNVGPASGC